MIFLKDSNFSAQYKNAVNNIALPENYKEKILSALREENKKLNGESTENTAEIIEFTSDAKTKTHKETSENPYNPEKKAKPVSFNIRRFIPAAASAAATIVLIIAAVLLFTRTPIAPKDTTFNFSVASATNLGNISGARIVFKDSEGNLIKDEEGNTITAYTNENGEVSVTLPSSEEYTAEVTAEGYITYEVPAQKNGHIYISPVMTEDTYRAVLTWEDDCDLDAILTVTKGDKSEQLFYFRSDIENEQGEVIAALDTDSRNSSTPETITFNTTDDSVFRFSVASYSALKNSDNFNLSTSGAQVVLYKGNRIVDVYEVPADVSGNAWCIFEVHNDKLEVHNEIYTVDSIMEVK